MGVIGGVSVGGMIKTPRGAVERSDCLKDAAAVNVLQVKSIFSTVVTQKEHR